MPTNRPDAARGLPERLRSIADGIVDTTTEEGQVLLRAADESGYRRVRMPLSEGHMDVSLSPDASPEAVEMLHRIGEEVERP